MSFVVIFIIAKPPKVKSFQSILCVRERSAFQKPNSPFRCIAHHFLQSLLLFFSMAESVFFSGFKF